MHKYPRIFVIKRQLRLYYKVLLLLPHAHICSNVCSYTQPKTIIYPPSLKHAMRNRPMLLNCEINRGGMRNDSLHLTDFQFSSDHCVG